MITEEVVKNLSDSATFLVDSIIARYNTPTHFYLSADRSTCRQTGKDPVTQSGAGFFIFSPSLYIQVFCPKAYGCAPQAREARRKKMK